MPQIKLLTGGLPMASAPAAVDARALSKHGAETLKASCGPLDLVGARPEQLKKGGSCGHQWTLVDTIYTSGVTRTTITTCFCV